MFVYVCALSGCVGDYTRQKELQAITEESLWLRHPELYCPYRLIALKKPAYYSTAHRCLFNVKYINIENKHVSTL